MWAQRYRGGQQGNPPRAKYTACYCCGEVGHNSNDCEVRAEATCTFCHKTGHLEKACNAKKANIARAVALGNENLNKRESNFFDGGECNVATLSHDNPELESEWLSTMAPDPLFSDWVADSGATHHFGIDRTLFSNLRTVAGGIQVIQITGTSIAAMEIGTVKLQVDGKDGMHTLELQNVILNETLLHNIFSLQEARRMGYEYIMGRLGTKVKLVNVLKNGDKEQVALITEAAGRWTLDTTTIRTVRPSIIQTFTAATT